MTASVKLLPVKLLVAWVRLPPITPLAMAVVAPPCATTAAWASAVMLVAAAAAVLLDAVICASWPATAAVTAGVPAVVAAS